MTFLMRENFLIIDELMEQAGGHGYKSLTINLQVLKRIVERRCR